jgi:hypothetical protein
MGKRITAKENLRSEIPETLTNSEARDFLKSGKFPAGHKAKKSTIDFAKKEMEKLKQENRQSKFIELCKKEGLIPIPEYKFHEKRRWRIDYYFEHQEKKVALEIEGGVFTKGRHTRGSGFVKDMEKYNEVSKHGIFLIRYQPKDLDNRPIEVINYLKEVLAA